MRTVLFVCTGNTCRSPMAEAIARHSIDSGLLEEGIDLFVTSAGVDASAGSPPTNETLTVLSKLGIDHVGVSMPLSADLVKNADLILCMTSSHQIAAQEMLPHDSEDQNKIQLLDPEGDIEDPLGMGQTTYDELAQRFMQLIPQRLREVFVT